jgi:hypothetical protein
MNHCFVLKWIVGVAVSFVAVTGRAEQQPDLLKVGDGSQWQFSGAPWQENGDGDISPPDQRNLHSRAFFRTKSFSDFSAEFEFNPRYREVGTGGAGFILRATDPNNFYAVYFPWGAQAMRGKHFLASIVKVDGDGYMRALKSDWVPNVISEVDRWYKVKVVATGSHVEVWVDGFRAVSTSEVSNASGAVGLIGYGWYTFRNLKVTGLSTPLNDWPTKAVVPVHSAEVKLTSKYSQSACVAPNGDVLLASGDQMLRSKDRGRTWSEPEVLPSFLGVVGDLGNCMFRAKDGRLLVQIIRGADNPDTNNPPTILMSESVDNGVNWSEPIASTVESGWPESVKLYPGGSIIQNDDGTLIRFLYGAVLDGRDNGSIATWGNWTKYKALAIRSSDGGKSWSKPIELDRPAFTAQDTRGTISGSLDFTEVAGVALGNRVMTLIRPVYSPYMWQCWSADSGANWDSAARTTFTGYGGPWLVRTQNGTLVCGHRTPHFALHLSSDGGLNWDEGTVIDYPAWANGTALEVEPNLLLCSYMNWDQSQPLIVQLVRVHPNRVEPLQVP